jgi:hypothetical protein
MSATSANSAPQPDFKRRTPQASPQRQHSRISPSSLNVDVREPFDSSVRDGLVGLITRSQSLRTCH